MNVYLHVYTCVCLVKVEAQECVRAAWTRFWAVVQVLATKPESSAKGASDNIWTISPPTRLLFCVCDKGSLYCSGWPGTYYAHEVGLKLTEESMYHHVWHPFPRIFFFKCWSTLCNKVHFNTLSHNLLNLMFKRTPDIFFSHGWFPFLPWL